MQSSYIDKSIATVNNPRAAAPAMTTGFASPRAELKALQLVGGLPSELDYTAARSSQHSYGGGNPSVGQEPSQTPAPSAPSAAPSAPANGGGNPSAAPSAPANGDSTPAAPETNAPADDQGTVTARVSITPSVDPTQASTPAAQNASSPTQARADALAATGASSVWVGVGAVAVLVAGAGAVVASRRAKR